jgi:predicted ATP-binding protein involved in virulence
MFGVTLGSYNKFEELYKFIMRTKNTMLKVKDTMASQIKDEAYVQNLKKAIDTAKNIAPASRSDRSYSDIGGNDQ